MAEHAGRALLSVPAEPASSPSSEQAKRWSEFEDYVREHDYDREQAEALLQLAVDTAEPSSRKSVRLQWRNIYAAIATLTRTDSETLHARLTIGFSPAEFKWMLQNKALYTWHSSPVRFQRCLQCMVAKLGQCGSQAEKTCWSCRSRLTDAPAGELASSGNALRPPRNFALTMAKTAAKQPIGPPEPDAHISMYEQAKWPLTKRDQTYLSQANKFWNFISTDSFLGITDRSQLLDLTHRACTKRYILYMHKMNKRENVRAAVDMHCLGLSPSQAQPELTQAETELEHQRSAGSGAISARAGSGYSIEQMQQMQAQQASGPEAAGHLAPGTLSGRQFSGEGSVYSDAPDSPSGARSSRRSSRLKPSQSEAGASASALHPELPEPDQPPSAGHHDWVNPSNELLATLRDELDLDLRDAPDDSDDGGSRAGEAGPTKKCRPWHWLPEMKRFGYERQVMPKDQKKKRKRAAVQPAAALASGGPSTSQQTVSQDVTQPQRRQPPRRRAQHQLSLDSDSSGEESPPEEADSGEEEEALPEPTRRQRSMRGTRQTLPALPLPQPPSGPSSDPGVDPEMFPASGWGSANPALMRRAQEVAEELSAAHVAEGLGFGLGLSPFRGGHFLAGSLGGPLEGSLPAITEPLAFNMGSSLDPRHRPARLPSPFETDQAPRERVARLPSPFETEQQPRERAIQGQPAAAVASLDLPPFSIPYSSRGTSPLAGAFGLHMDSDLAQGHTNPAPLQQRYFLPAHSSSGGSMFSQNPQQSLLSRHSWASQGSQHPSFHPLAPHHSAPATFSSNTSNLSHSHQPPSLFSSAQSDQQRSSLFGQHLSDPQHLGDPHQQQQHRQPSPSLFQSAHSDLQRSGVFGQGDQQQHQQGDYPMGSLEQHYLARLQAGTTRGTGHPSFAGARGSSMLGVGLPSGQQQQQRQQHHQQLQQQQQQQPRQQREHQSVRTSNWLDSLSQQVAQGEPRQFNDLARSMQGYTGPQAPMSLEDLSAMMQAEQAQEAPPLPALPAQPPLTLANSYLSRLKAHAPSNQPGATAPGPMTGHGRHTAALYEQAIFGQGAPYLENMQMPSMPTGSLHSMRDPTPSAFDSRAGSDTDARSETAEDHPRF